MLWQPGDFASSIDGSKFAPKDEIIFGYDCYCGRSSNIAVSLEAKAALQRFESENYDDLTMIKATYTPTFGGNVVLHLSKHCKTQFAIYGGAGYTRLSSDYATPEDGTYLKNVSHNTMSYEAGAQAMWRCKLGTMIGVKAGYNHTYTNHISQGMFSVGVVVKLKKVYKSRAIKYSDYVNQ